MVATLLLGASAVPKLFRARAIPLDLESDVWIGDARRDGRAVGSTAGKMTLGYGPSRAFAIFGGRAVFGEGSEGAETEPCAITGDNRFVVEFRQDGGQRWYRTASVIRGRIRLGGLVPRPRSAKEVKTVSQSSVRFDARYLPNGAGVKAVYEKTFGVDWFNLPRRLSVGNGVVNLYAYGDGEGRPDVNMQIPIPLVRLPNGRIERLEDAVSAAGWNGTYRSVVWVSPEGWFIVSTTSALVWLEPISTRRTRPSA